jgi:sulfite oxidase
MGFTPVIDFKSREAKEFPVFRRVEIAKHRTFATKVWVSYEDSVYDISDFIKVHPGGAEKLMMAAGGAIEPFWEMYPFHKKDAVKELLVPYKIG